MELSELIQEISKENLELIKNESIKLRSINFQFYPNKIMTIIGVRRGGKSSIQKKVIQRLLSENRNFESIFFVNFEDDRLSNMSAHEFGAALDNYLLTFNHEKSKFFFFDEIQNLENWEKLVRRLTEQKHKVCITGSSAKTLSKEIATSLRGRSLTYTIYPLSFFEWLDFKGLHNLLERILKSDFLLSDIYQPLMEFLNTGGFPELSLLPKKIHREILKDYVDVMLFRDVIERNNFTDEKLVREIFKFSIQQVAQSFSVNKLNNDLKSRGYSFSKNFTYQVIEAFQDAFAIFSIPIFSSSIRKQQSNPKKCYNIDNGLKTLYSLSNQSDFGRRFENLIFLDLLRTKHEVFYYLTEKSRLEIDFICVKNNITTAYQVSFNSKTKNEPLEKKAQSEVFNELGLNVEYISPENYIQFLKKIITAHD